jgi:uncharacterized cofD-like protein
MARIVAMGGGTGLPVVLRALATVPEFEATALVTVTDNGGSSGRLCETFGIPAVGDLRNCLVALSGGNSILADLFQHRFADGDGLCGHSLGNLIVTALCEQTGSLEGAVEIMGRLLPLKGRAIPTTTIPATLCAEFTDGSVIHGECQISAAGKRIARIWLNPVSPAPAPGVIDAIGRADVIVFSPGSLYSSLLPNLLVAGVVEAIRASDALKIFVCNLMTQPGETDGFTAADHLAALEAYVGGGVVDVCVANSDLAVLRARCAESKSQCVQYDPERIHALGPIPIAEKLAAVEPNAVQHDPHALGRLLWQLSSGWIAPKILEGRPAEAFHSFVQEQRETVCPTRYIPS